MNPHYWRVAARARNRCKYCGAPQGVFNYHFETEHVVPRSKGGTNDDQNFALACRACNVRKSDHTNEVDSGSIVPLFNPRMHVWSVHFEVDATTFMIIGRTAIGRVTVARLGFNEATQLLARKEWFRLGMFPPA